MVVGYSMHSLVDAYAMLDENSSSVKSSFRRADIVSGERRSQLLSAQVSYIHEFTHASSSAAVVRVYVVALLLGLYPRRLLPMTSTALEVACILLTLTPLDWLYCAAENQVA